MVYIDHPPAGLAMKGRRPYCHMFADSIDELHRFAERVGIHHCWYSNKRGKNQPHYDVREELLTLCVLAGAVEVPWREVPARMHAIYGSSIKE